MDYQKTNALKLEEVHELFKWTIKGIGRITHNQMPPQKSIQLVSYKAFNSADSDGDGTLDLLELKNWMEINQVFIQFCKKFEPNTKTIYDFSLFDRFPEFSVNSFTDQVLDTKSDLSHINKGTFSSVQRLMQGMRSLKEELERTGPSIERIKRVIQRQEREVTDKRENEQRKWVVSASGVLSAGEEDVAGKRFRKKMEQLTGRRRVGVGLEEEQFTPLNEYLKEKKQAKSVGKIRKLY